MSRFLVVACTISLILAFASMTYCAYVWSFTDTTFGGWLGFFLPVINLAIATMAGLLFPRKVAQENAN